MHVIARMYVRAHLSTAITVLHSPQHVAQKPRFVGDPLEEQTSKQLKTCQCKDASREDAQFLMQLGSGSLLVHIQNLASRTTIAACNVANEAHEATGIKPTPRDQAATCRTKTKSKSQRQASWTLQSSIPKPY